MDILEIILAVTSCFLLCIFLFLLMIFSARDDSYKPQEETKEIKLVAHDAEYNKLVEQYGRTVVLMAELEYNKLIFDLNGKENISISFADECEIQNEKAKKLKEQEAEIKRIKSLSKEELELYLLQEEAIKQIKSK